MLHKGLFSYGARAEIFTFYEVMCVLERYQMTFECGWSRSWRC